jgi:hypothetical protein
VSERREMSIYVSTYIVNSERYPWTSYMNYISYVHIHAYSPSPSNSDSYEVRIKGGRKAKNQMIIKYYLIIKTGEDGSERKMAYSYSY